MTFATEIAQASTAGIATARQAAVQAGIVGVALGAAALEGKWVAISEIAQLPAINALTAEKATEARLLLDPYSRNGWMFAPGAGVDLDAKIAAGQFRIGTGAALPSADAGCLLMVTALRMVDGIISDAARFVAHGAPTAPKAPKFDGIAVKFVDDHLCKDEKEAVAASQRRAIARSTMLQLGEATLFSRDMNALNAASYFQYVEAYLAKTFSWTPDYIDVSAICYVSRDSVRIGWEIIGTKTKPSNPAPFDTFSKPTKVTGHLMYAVKSDGADPNAATDVGKCKRLMYHFEGLLADPAAPGPGWTEVTVDAVLKAAGLKTGQETGIRAAAVRCYYRTAAH